MKSKIFLLLAAIVVIAGCVSQVPQASEQTPQQSGGENQTPLTNLSVPNVSAPNESAAGFDYMHYTPPAVEITYPLLLKFPIVRSPMPYYVFNESEINEYKYNLTLENLRYAFDEWENATRDRVRFVQVNESPEQGVMIEIVPSLVNFSMGKETIGEAAPTYYQFADYSVIVGGDMKIFPLYGGSENRVTLVHEMGHIMGLDHNNNSHSVLYPWNAYSQEITPDILEALDILYQDIPVSQ